MLQRNRWVIFILTLLWVTACTLTGAPETAPTAISNVGTGEAPDEVLTPNALRTPQIAGTATLDPDTCRAVNDALLAMRIATDIQATEVTILEANSTSPVIGRTGSNTWWQIRSPEGQTGWIDASAVQIYGECTGVPVVASGTVTPAPSSTPSVPIASIKVDLNVRRGPSIRFSPPIGSFDIGDTTEIIAVNTTRDWYKIVYNGSQGWISGNSEFIDIGGNISNLPVDPGPPTPTATNTPIPATPTATLDPTINYLNDPGFEGQYTSRGASDFNIPAAWQVTVVESPRDYEWQNIRPFAFPHINPPEIHGGARSLNMSRDYGTFTTIVYQRAEVPANISVHGSAWVWLHTCNPTPAICNSEGSSNARARVGIDPTGGTNAFDGSVVWSGFQSPHDTWGNIGVSTTAQGSVVTLFLYTTQDTPKGLNRVYWDDAVLNVGG